MSPVETLHGQLVPQRGGPWKDICQLRIREPQLRERMIRGLPMDVGNGRTTRFWEDVWLPGGVLKEMFPRLFSVSSLKESVIGDCGFWDGLERIWSFQWRRQLFQWKLELLNQLHEILLILKLTSEREDRVVWKFDRTGIFSTKSFILVMQEAALPEEITSYSFTSGIWRGFVPPRVELFTCKAEESAFHLFVGCEITWRVWSAWLFAFGRSWTIPGTLKQHFESWQNATQRKLEKKRWLVGFFAVIWAIWLERNNRVFNNHGSRVMEIINKSFMYSDEWLGSASWSVDSIVEDDKGMGQLLGLLLLFSTCLSLCHVYNCSTVLC
ncbi:uncharacterized protein LOC130963610 [Arachis stenosperma]|uniref:uncharacterized protein LOC130963610 n=1 Tax=Arachis stenosperma TaxID=217475 RepID=UPI0025AC0625|nr:uncharacterized protein LOC130963610 [Arachis stenosperma]